MWKINPKIFYSILYTIKMNKFREKGDTLKQLKNNVLSGVLLFYAIETIIWESIIFLYLCLHLLLSLTFSS